MSQRWSDTCLVRKNFVVAALALSLSGQLVPAISVSAIAASKKASMQVPINEKMDDTSAPGAAQDDATAATLAPMTLDQAKPDQPDIGGASGAQDETPKADLAPVTLDSSSSGKAAGGKEEVLKSTVSETDFVPKGPVSKGVTAVPPLSVKDGIPGSLEEKVIRDARKENILPLALMESRDEVTKKEEAKFDAEKVELTDLWNATLTRSPDIQFVTQKLLPSSKPGHTTEVMMRFLQCAMFAGMGAANMMSPNMGMYAVSGMGSGIVSSALGMGQSNAAKKARLSQTETIMLYNMVRNTADHLVENYRNYKSNLTTEKLAQADFSDLQSMVKDARATQDDGKAVEMAYTIRRAERELNMITGEVRKFRQTLVDLAGVDAVAKLDKQLDDETLAIDPTLEESMKEEAAKPGDIKPADVKPGDMLLGQSPAAEAPAADATAEAPAADQNVSEGSKAKPGKSKKKKTTVAGDSSKTTPK